MTTHDSAASRASVAALNCRLSGAVRHSVRLCRRSGERSRPQLPPVGRAARSCRDAHCGVASAADFIDKIHRSARLIESLA